jgi:pilus assembly protein CpaB
MVAVAPVAAGEQLTLGKLAYPKGLGAGAGLASATPVGKRAITIAVDNVASLAGMLKPGDYVDVISLLPVPVEAADGTQAKQAAVVPLFQNVLVLAVGQDTGTSSAPGVEQARYKEETKTTEASLLITLALSPQEANLLAFAQEQGKIRLALRSPADSKVELLQPAGWETLFQHLMPKEAATAAEAQKEKTQEGLPGRTVEIYRGLHKENVAIN